MINAKQEIYEHLCVAAEVYSHWPDMPLSLNIEHEEHLKFAQIKLVAIFLKVFKLQYLNELSLEEALDTLGQADTFLYPIANNWIRSALPVFVVEMDALVAPTPFVLSDDIHAITRADHWTENPAARTLRADHFIAKADQWFDAGVWTKPQPINNASANPATLYYAWRNVTFERISQGLNNQAALGIVAENTCTACDTVKSNFYAGNAWLAGQGASFYGYAQNRLSELDYQQTYYQEIRNPLSLLYPPSADGNKWDREVEQKRYGKDVKNAIRKAERKIWAQVTYKYNRDKNKTNPKKQEAIDVLGYKDVVGVARMFDEMDEREVNQMLDDPGIASMGNKPVSIDEVKDQAKLGEVVEVSREPV